MKRGKYAKRYPSGSMAALNWQQFKAFLKADRQFEKRKTVDTIAVRQRIYDSLKPAKDHAELVESDKQNRFAAELWKAHAEAAAKSMRLHAEILELLADKLTDYANGGLDAGETANILRDCAAAMRNAKL